MIFFILQKRSVWKARKGLQNRDRFIKSKTALRTFAVTRHIDVYRNIFFKGSEYSVSPITQTNNSKNIVSLLFWELIAKKNIIWKPNRKQTRILHLIIFFILGRCSSDKRRSLRIFPIRFWLLPTSFIAGSIHPHNWNSWNEISRNCCQRKLHCLLDRIVVGMIIQFVRVLKF